MALLNWLWFSRGKDSIKKSRLDRSIRYCRSAGICSNDMFIRGIYFKVSFSSFKRASVSPAEYSPRRFDDESAGYVLTMLTILANIFFSCLRHIDITDNSMIVNLSYQLKAAF